MNIYKTDKKTYIENELGICVARFSSTTMEVYLPDGKMEGVKIKETFNPTESDWIKFKSMVNYLMDFEVTDEFRPDSVKKS